MQRTMSSMTKRTARTSSVVRWYVCLRGDTLYWYIHMVTTLKSMRIELAAVNQILHTAHSTPCIRYQAYNHLPYKRMLVAFHACMHMHKTSTGLAEQADGNNVLQCQSSPLECCMCLGSSLHILD